MGIVAPRVSSTYKCLVPLVKLWLLQIEFQCKYHNVSEHNGVFRLVWYDWSLEMSISSNFLNQGRDSHGWLAGVIGQKLPRLGVIGRIVVGGKTPFLSGAVFGATYRAACRWRLSIRGEHCRADDAERFLWKSAIWPGSLENDVSGSSCHAATGTYLLVLTLICLWFGISASYINYTLWLFNIAMV